MSVCINPTWVNYASEELKDSDVKVCTVIGFPLGANTSEVKAFEAKNAIERAMQLGMKGEKIQRNYKAICQFAHKTNAR